METPFSGRRRFDARRRYAVFSLCPSIAPRLDSLSPLDVRLAVRRKSGCLCWINPRCWDFAAPSKSRIRTTLLSVDVADGPMGEWALTAYRDATKSRLELMVRALASTESLTTLALMKEGYLGRTAKGTSAPGTAVVSWPVSATYCNPVLQSDEPAPLPVTDPDLAGTRHNIAHGQTDPGPSKMSLLDLASFLWHPRLAEAKASLLPDPDTGHGTVSTAPCLNLRDPLSPSPSRSPIHNRNHNHPQSIARPRPY
ncbi:hypothetical protein NM208_g16137 [Fusarium decemcellulare]|uniref:Uncharacterized protein n=1 Tax=Fusarium decemcellulare TaxID=57161 RepID=A0ACC1RB65_9HYPO|nr:hypothetical protein NM208_g16137 [Fusarium decemcellulare]